MKKQRIILFWAIVLLNILLLKYENISASVTYDGDGLGSTATGSGSGNCGTNGVQWTVGAGYGYLISLVKVSNEIGNPTAYPELKSYFYYLDSINESSFLNPDKNGNKYNFFGNRKVVGYMDGNNYSTGAIEVGAPEHKKNGFDNYTTKSSIVTKDSNTQQNIYNNSPYYLYRLGFKTSIMYTITGKKTKETLVNNPNETYMMLYMLYNRMSNEDKEKLGQAVNDKMNTFDPKMNDYNELSSIEQYFSDYRIIIEPIYRFNQCNGSQKVFATIKAVAAKNKTEANFFGGYWDFSNITDLFYSTSDHGPIKGINNCSGNSLLDKLADVNCGYGYLTITITDEKTKCDPSNPNVCCYDEDGKYHEEYNAYNKEEHYKCNDLLELGVDCSAGRYTKCVPPEEEPTLCPNGTVPYTNYYLFLAGYDGSSYDKTTIGNFGYSEYRLFKSLQLNSNNEIHARIAQRIPIDKDNIKWFYENWAQAVTATGQWYYTTDKQNYYIWHNANCDNFLENCENSDSKTNIDMATRIKNGNGINDIIAATVLADEVEITKAYEQPELGYNFQVTRKINGKKKLINPEEEAVLSGGLKEYLHPAVYQMTYCISDSPCQDDIDNAICSSDSDITTAHFYENSNLKQCTLADNDSGFNIVDNDYCRISCKDDIDIVFPTKFGYDTPIKTGTYFILNASSSDKYVPSIKGVRTCISNKVDIDGFKKDEENGRKDVETSYSAYTNAVAKYNYVNNDQNYTDNSDTAEVKTREYNCTTPPDTNYENCVKTYDQQDDVYKNMVPKTEYEAMCRDQNPMPTKTCDTCTYKIIEWQLKESSPYKESGKYSSNEACKQADDTRKPQDLKDEAEKDMNDKKEEYNRAREKYESTISDFKMCNILDGENSTENIVVNKNIAYNFEPDLEFDYGYSPLTKRYDERDSEVVAGKMHKTKKESINYSYWKNNEPDDSYNQNAEEKKNRKYSFLKFIEAGGIRKPVYGANGKVETSEVTLADYNYAKSVQTVTYNYNLPQIYTIIPSGSVLNYLPTSTNNIQYSALPQNAVPINIKTVEGNYRYYITLSNIVSSNDIRSKVGNDTYTERFNLSGVIGLNSSSIATLESTYTCDYKVINDIFDPDPDPDPGNPNPGLLYFYRVIDLSNINPLGRTLGRNWTTAKSSLIEERMKETDSDYQKLHANEELNDESTTVRSDVDKFEFTLTPTLMRAIRSYDVNHKYEDFNLICNNTNDENRYYCRSILLSCITSSGHTSETAAACDERILNAVQNYELDSPEYLYNDLRENRDRLINKNVALATH